MMAGLMVSILWLLAMVASGVFVRDCPRTLAVGSALIAVAVGIFYAASWFSPQPNWVGVLLGIMAFWRLIQGPLPKASILLGGVSAGLAAALQVAGGVPLWLVGMVTLAGLLIAFALRASPESPDAQNSETKRAYRPLDVIFIVVAVIAPIAGLAGDLIFGWQSAVMLNREAEEVALQAPPLWVISIIGIALVAGLVRGKLIKQ